VTGTPEGKADGTRPIPVAHTKKLPCNTVYGFLPGDLHQAVSLALERGREAVRAVVVAPLVEALVADVSPGVEVVLVAAYLDDSLVLVQGHDQAAVAAAQKASRNLLLHETSLSPSMIRAASRRARVSDIENFDYRII
jgi:hypothetical protein